MINFRVESWTALAPGLDTTEQWLDWLQQPQPIDAELGKVPLKQIPPILRRRFSTLGKCAVGAALSLLHEGESIPCVFASRHGDIELTFSLLQEMGKDEPMSPTGFSLAVHNAVSGLFSIARKDTSEVTAIAASEGLVVQALIETAGQLLNRDRVLCVIYDVPLPALYQTFTDSDPFPYAIAMVLNREVGEQFTLQLGDSHSVSDTKLTGELDTQPLKLIELLVGASTQVCLSAKGCCWQLSKADA